VSSASFTIGRADVALAQPLELTSTGSLITWPNPFATSTYTQFTPASGSAGGLSVFSLANLRVRVLVASASWTGTHLAQWDGTDDASQAVADGAYWIAFTGDGNEWAELVFKGP
jgi:flagellar hook assembly protein FlgD